MREIVGFPLWWIIVMAVLLLAREIASAVRDKAFAELWKLYWDERRTTEGGP